MNDVRPIFRLLTIYLISSFGSFLSFYAALFLIAETFANGLRLVPMTLAMRTLFGVVTPLWGAREFQSRGVFKTSLGAAFLGISGSVLCWIGIIYQDIWVVFFSFFLTSYACESLRMLLLFATKLRAENDQIYRKIRGLSFGLAGGLTALASALGGYFSHGRFWWILFAFDILTFLALTIYVLAEYGWLNAFSFDGGEAQKMGFVQVARNISRYWRYLLASFCVFGFVALLPIVATDPLTLTNLVSERWRFVFLTYDSLAIFIAGLLYTYAGNSILRFILGVSFFNVIGIAAIVLTSNQILWIANILIWPIVIEMGFQFLRDKFIKVESAQEHLRRVAFSASLSQLIFFVSPFLVYLCLNYSHGKSLLLLVLPLQTLIFAICEIPGNVEARDGFDRH